MTVLIAGAGIAGLTLGLTLHQIGVPFRIYEAVRTPRPLGVGINIQPNAVRELLDLGLQDMLETIGIATQEYGFFTKTGLEIWTEPRGRAAGYHWPQYSVHRGALQMALMQILRDRAGPDCIVTGHRATAARSRGDDIELTLETSEGIKSVAGEMVLAADGINSALRAQMYPDEGPPIWNGCVLWRGTSLGKPFRTGASMILSGHDDQRFVAYPIAAADPKSGLARINWIAEIRRDPGSGWRQADYNASVAPETILPAFRDWNFGWLDCPGLIATAEQIFEYPMVDRDPLPKWRDGRLCLLGDAAHPAYPVGSNGASQAIVDARMIGAGFLRHGIKSEALQEFEDKVRPQMAQVVAANRSGAGPDGVMQIVEDRCGGTFDRIDDVISHRELADHAAHYKSLAGFDIDELNRRPALIAR